MELGAPSARSTWPNAASDLDADQLRLAALEPELWLPPDDGFLAGGCFLAFASGQAGPGEPGDRGWVGAAVLTVPGFETVARAALSAVVGASYEAGHLALREGPALEAAVAALDVRPDVLLVDATGRDHPRRAGLALHLGAMLDLPTVGVTHRPLLANGPEPPEQAGAHTPLLLDGKVVGAWLRTQPSVRPLAVHSAWRTDPDGAVAVVLRCVDRARTPEPLREARVTARVTRAVAERRAPTSRDPRGPSA